MNIDPDSMKGKLLLVFFEKFFIALIISCVYYGFDYIKAKEDNQNRADKEKREVEVKLFELAIVEIKKISNKDTTQNEKTASREVILQLSNFLNDKYQSTSLAALSRIAINADSESSVNEKLQITEIADAVNSKEEKQATGSRYFAVLGSYPATQEGLLTAKKDKDKLVIALSKEKDSLNYRLFIYKTKISNNYAIVLNAATEDRAMANNWVAHAKRLGLANDAFTQQDRGWTPVLN